MTLLGTGTPRPRIDQFGPSVLVEAGARRFLFDCGRGATLRLAQLDLAPGAIDGLFITHLHSDHVVGFPDLWLTGWTLGRAEPLQVWGPEGTREMVAALENAFAFDIRVRSQGREKIDRARVGVLAKDVKSGIVYSEDGIRVTAFAVDHGPVKPALGYRLDYGGRSVAISGDTRPSESLIEHARGVDLLLHEAIPVETFRASVPWLGPERVAAILEHHTTPEQAGKVFSRVKPRLAVYYHYGHGPAPRAEFVEELLRSTPRTYSGPFEVGEDLMIIEVGEEIEVRRRKH